MQTQKSRALKPDVSLSVGSQEIGRAEAEKYYSNRLNDQSQAQPGAYPGQPQSQEEALTLMMNIVDELINNDILLQRAQKLGLQATDGEVEDKFTEFKSPYTEEEFQKQLKERGVSIDDLKQDIRKQLSVQKLLNKEVASKVPPLPIKTSPISTINTARNSTWPSPSTTSHRSSSLPRKDARRYAAAGTTTPPQTLEAKRKGSEPSNSNSILGPTSTNWPAGLLRRSGDGTLGRQT